MQKKGHGLLSHFSSLGTLFEPGDNTNNNGGEGGRKRERKEMEKKRKRGEGIETRGLQRTRNSKSIQQFCRKRINYEERGKGGEKTKKKRSGGRSSLRLPYYACRALQAGRPAEKNQGPSGGGARLYCPKRWFVSDTPTKGNRKKGRGGGATAIFFPLPPRLDPRAAGPR